MWTYIELILFVTRGESFLVRRLRSLEAAIA
jgi:hypothetical protein